MTTGITPCDDDDDVVCDSDKDDPYPDTEIDTMLTSHAVFKSKAFFGTIFGDVCEPLNGKSQLKLALSIGNNWLKRPVIRK